MCHVQHKKWHSKDKRKDEHVALFDYFSFAGERFSIFAFGLTGVGADFIASFTHDLAYFCWADDGWDIAKGEFFAGDIGSATGDAKTLLHALFDGALVGRIV